MGRKNNFSQHPDEQAPNTAAMRWKWNEWAGLLVSLILCVQLSGCASVSTPTASELTNVNRGEKVIVLFRVTCMIEGQPYEPFSFSTIIDNVNFGLGSFETAGEPRLVMNRYLSEASRREGWTYLVLSPGIYYLAVRPPQRTDGFTYDRMLQSAPRWRIDVSKQAKLMYVGTLSLSGTADKLLFSGRIMSAIYSDDARIENEYVRASRLLSEHFPGLGTPQTVLMKRWKEGDPIFIRSPE